MVAQSAFGVMNALKNIAEQMFISSNLDWL
jgi:hypothetical protein